MRHSSLSSSMDRMNNLLLPSPTNNFCAQYQEERNSSTENRILQHSSSSFKATVYRTCMNGQHVVIKDYANSHPFFRATICQYLLRREIKAIKRAQNIIGVPTFLGTYGRYGFVIELIEGCETTESMLSSHRRLLCQLEKRIQALHNSGVTHNDIRLSNLLVDNCGLLYIIDFAGAVLRPKWTTSLSYVLFKIARLSDQVKVVRLKQKFGQELLSDQEKRLIIYGKLFKFISLCWKKYIYSWMKN